MRIKKFNENIQYINDGSGGACPVCGNYKNLKKSKSEPTESGMEYYYECLDCDFKWYEQYIMIDSGVYDNTGNEIFNREDVDPGSYNSEKLDFIRQQKKYNI